MSRREGRSRPEVTGHRSGGAASSSLRDAFWARHSNPWSGATRILATPLLMYALYARKRRLVAAALAFLVVNPVLFPRPARTDSWLSRGVQAERAWLREGRGAFGSSFPNVLNLLAVPASLVALYAALRRRPVLTVVATAGSMVLKLWWVDAIIRRTADREHQA